MLGRGRGAWNSAAEASALPVNCQRSSSFTPTLLAEQWDTREEPVEQGRSEGGGINPGVLERTRKEGVIAS